MNWQLQNIIDGLHFYELTSTCFVTNFTIINLVLFRYVQGFLWSCKSRDTDILKIEPITLHYIIL